MMKKCPKCGKENPNDLYFCDKCGEPLPEPKNLLKKILISVAILLIIGLIVGALSSDIFSSDSNQNDVSVKNSSTVNDHIQSNDSFKDSSNGNDEKQTNDTSVDTSTKKPSSSTKNVDFDGLFTMDVDKYRDFEPYTDLSDDYCEGHWYAHEDVTKDDYPMEVYYWLSDKDYNFYALDNYNGPVNDGKLKIFTFDYKQEDYPQSCDYMVFVSNDNEVVAIQGADLDTLKDYANSVKF